MGRTRLWALSPQGTLLFSENMGGAWQSALDGVRARFIATDISGNIAVLVTGNGSRLLLTQSADRWRRWSAITMPIAATGQVNHLAICEHVALIGMESPAAFFVKADGIPWTPLFTGLTTPIVVIKEFDTIVAYSWVLLRSHEVAVARWPLSPASRKPAVVLLLDGIPRHLYATRTDGLTFLDIITKSAWYRVTVNPNKP